MRPPALDGPGVAVPARLPVCRRSVCSRSATPIGPASKRGTVRRGRWYSISSIGIMRNCFQSSASADSDVTVRSRRQILRGPILRAAIWKIPGQHEPGVSNPPASVVPVVLLRRLAARVGPGREGTNQNLRLVRAHRGSCRSPDAATAAAVRDQAPTVSPGFGHRRVRAKGARGRPDLGPVGPVADSDFYVGDPVMRDDDVGLVHDPGCYPGSSSSMPCSDMVVAV
jgi:hypothetical protein